MLVYIIYVIWILFLFKKNNFHIFVSDVVEIKTEEPVGSVPQFRSQEPRFRSLGARKAYDEPLDISIQRKARETEEDVMR